MLLSRNDIAGLGATRCGEQLLGTGRYVSPASEKILNKMLECGVDSIQLAQIATAAQKVSR